MIMVRGLTGGNFHAPSSFAMSAAAVARAKSVTQLISSSPHDNDPGGPPECRWRHLSSFGS
jgi:hypothetical protein